MNSIQEILHRKARGDELIGFSKALMVEISAYRLRQAQTNSTIDGDITIKCWEKIDLRDYLN